MKVHRVVIDQQMGQIEVTTTRARLNIETARREMNIENKPAKASIERKAPQLHLDQTNLRNNTARRGISAEAQAYAQKAASLARQGIEQTASDGNFVGTLPGHNNGIPDVALSHMLEVNTPSYDRSTVPSQGVAVRATPGDVNINWANYDVEISWDEMQLPSITVEPKPSVNIQLATRPSLEVEVVEEEIPPEMPGQIVDTNG